MKRLLISFPILLIFMIVVSGIACSKQEDSGNSATDTMAPIISLVTSSGITQTSATITWTTDEMATGNLIYGLTTSYGFSSPTPTDTTIDNTNHTILLNSLSPNATYHYQVKSKDASSNEAVSSDYTFATLADTTAPVITNVTSSGITQTQATITWTTNELTTSNLVYGLTTSYGSLAPVLYDKTADNTSHSVVLSGLSLNTTYNFRVMSNDASNNEGVSANLTFVTQADTTAPVISNVAVSDISETSVVITWNTDEIASSGVVFGLTTSYGKSSPTIADTTADKTSHSVVLSSLSPNTIYHYRIMSKDASNNEAISTDITFSTIEATAKNGDTVSVNYTLKLADGTVLQTSVGSDPFQFTLGTGQVIQGFNDAVIGMKPGESKTVTILAADAYGPHLDELVTEVDRSKLPTDIVPVVGMHLQANNNGTPSDVVIVAVSDTTVTIDFNNPLAGKDLTFDIKLIGII